MNACLYMHIVSQGEHKGKTFKRRPTNHSRDWIRQEGSHPALACAVSSPGRGNKEEFCLVPPTLCRH